MEIAADQPYQRNPHTAWQSLEEGSLVLHLREHEMSALNPTGTRLWDALATPQTARQLGDLLTATFDVSPAEAQAAVQAFLADLLAKDLITPAPPGTGGG